MQGFVWDAEKKTFRQNYKAPDSTLAHDDEIMALAIANEMRTHTWENRFIPGRLPKEGSSRLMRAKYRENGLIEVSGTTRNEDFNRIWAGMGWPETRAGTLLCRRRARGRSVPRASWEMTGGLWELGDSAVRSKGPVSHRGGLGGMPVTRSQPLISGLCLACAFMKSHRKEVARNCYQRRFTGQRAAFD